MTYGDNDNRVDIKLSRSKLFLILVGAFFFILIGGLFIYDPQRFMSSFIRSQVILYVIGIASICYFGACLLYGLYKFTDSNIGIRLDSVGLYDNSSAASIGLIRWQDITGFRIEKIQSTQILIVLISDNDKYVNNASNFLVKFLLKMSIKMYGSPIAITSNTLKIDFDLLNQLVNDHWRKFR